MAPLREYQRKRQFEKTPEPSGTTAPSAGHSFVVQRHAARRLHYDFRLEIDGVLKSWAVPKGPSLNPADKRLAVQTEDHPLDYASFEGVIPQGNYGAGTVMVWDNGTFAVEGNLPASQQLARGELKFSLRGQKLRGSFVLVKLRRSAKDEWLLIKHRDAAADEHWNAEEHDRSMITGRTMAEITRDLPASQAPPATEPSQLDGARKAKFPAAARPMLATLADKPFSDPNWLFEIKLDGVRALAFVRDGRLELRSRTERVITPQYPELAALTERLRATEAVLDGEIVTLDEQGRSQFERLQTRMNVSAPSPPLIREVPVIYYLFDMIYCDGYDLREAPLRERKDFLRGRLDPGEPFRYADHVAEKGKELFELARAQGLEGIIGKDARSPYTNDRSTHWLKFKIVQELEALVGGWSAPRGSREHFGALLLGLYEGTTLRYIGSVGTGFDEKGLKTVYDQLTKLATGRSPFVEPPKLREQISWVEPTLVARVKYANWTKDRQLRAPVFLCLLSDRNPKECRFQAETPVAASSIAQQREDDASAGRAPAIHGQVLTKTGEIEQELFRGRADNVSVELEAKRLQLTNLNKVYFPESGYTKRDLLACYYRMADYLLPFLIARPLVLRRYPNGITGKSFFQKDAAGTAPDWMDTARIYSEENRGDIEYFIANDRASLLYLTNLGCIDHNPWPSRRDDLEHPDYFFFDLDPSEGTEFSVVVSVARAIFEKLQKIGMEAFLKTSGATGFHLYVPVERRYTYEQVRMFADIVGRVVSADVPELVTRERMVNKRVPGRVLIDAAQNALGRPLAAPYTVRAFPEAPVSAPISPAELRSGLRPERFNLKTITHRLEKAGDLWRDFFEKRQRLEDATKALSAQL